MVHDLANQLVLVIQLVNAQLLVHKEWTPIGINYKISIYALRRRRNPKLHVEMMSKMPKHVHKISATVLICY